VPGSLTLTHCAASSALDSVDLTKGAGNATDDSVSEPEEFDSRSAAIPGASGEASDLGVAGSQSATARDAAEDAKSSVKTVSGRLRPHESSDDYPAIVAMLDAKTRVIAADIQWIVQRRVNGGRYPWQSQYFCRTKAGLLLYAGRTKPDVAPPPPPPELLALPDFFPERTDEWIDWPPDEGAP
jgi:hypothetical protein